MNFERFDGLARAFGRAATRRGVVRGVVTTSLAGAVGIGVGRDALACQPDGTKCSAGAARLCCSGVCKKHGKRRRCAAAPSAFGCTNDPATDTCAGNHAPCPQKPTGQCIVDEKSRPLCYGAALCIPCVKDADCGAGARCIKDCDACSARGGTACVVPAA